MPQREQEGRPVVRRDRREIKGKPDAEAIVSKHLTSAEKAKFPDGHEEEHKVIKANEAELKNIVAWILAQ